MHRNGTRFDDDGYNILGYRDGYNRDGLDRHRRDKATVAGLIDDIEVE